MKKMLLIGILLTTFALMTPTFAEPATEPTCIMMTGLVQSYGVEPTYGWCGAYAEVGEQARVHVFWAPGILIPMPPMFTENLTTSFYSARLVNTTAVELNVTGKDLSISGFWDVYNITMTAVVYNVTYTYNNYTCTYPQWNVSWTYEVLVYDGLGELSVTGNWTDFTVDITGVELISGIVLFKYESIDPIPIGDIYGPYGTPDYTIDIWDLQHVAHAYGSTPVLDFDFSMDFDFDFEVGLCELTTIAANMGIEY